MQIELHGRYQHIPIHKYDSLYNLSYSTMSHTDNMIIDEANAKDLFETAADDLLQDEEKDVLLTDMTNLELVEQLILAKAQQQHFTELEKKIKDELLNRSDFTKMDYQGIVVDVRQTKRVSFVK